MNNDRRAFELYTSTYFPSYVDGTLCFLLFRNYILIVRHIISFRVLDITIVTKFLESTTIS